MSLKSRGRSPGGNGGHPRQPEVTAGRGASLGAGHAGEITFYCEIQNI